MHGLSAVNAAMMDRFAGAGATVTRIDLSPGSLRSDLRFYVRRLSRWIGGLGRLAWMTATRQRVAVYIAISGGAGQWLDIPFVLLGRLARGPLAIHHHSFAYVDRTRPAASLLMRVAGKRARHVVLCGAMGGALAARYSGAGHVIALSNAAVIAVEANEAQARRTMKTIGYLSNVSMAKGIAEFLEIARRACALRPDLSVLIAGPFHDAEAERLVTAAIAADSAIRHVGPVYGEAKTQFFATIDALVFPTRYVNEAEPLVLHEALAAGIPVIASARGCICDIIGDGGGMAISEDETGVAQAIDQLVGWAESPALYAEAAGAARARFQLMQAGGEEALENFLTEMVGGEGE